MKRARHVEPDEERELLGVAVPRSRTALVPVAEPERQPLDEESKGLFEAEDARDDDDDGGGASNPGQVAFVHPMTLLTAVDEHNRRRESLLTSEQAHLIANNRILHALALEITVESAHQRAVARRLFDSLLAHEAWFQNLPAIFYVAGWARNNANIVFVLDMTLFMCRAATSTIAHSLILLVDALAQGYFTTAIPAVSRATYDALVEGVAERLADIIAASPRDAAKRNIFEQLYTKDHVFGVTPDLKRECKRLFSDACMTAMLIHASAPLEVMSDKWPPLTTQKKKQTQTHTAAILTFINDKTQACAVLSEWMLNDPKETLDVLLTDDRIPPHRRTGRLTELLPVFALLGKEDELNDMLATRMVHVVAAFGHSSDWKERAVKLIKIARIRPPSRDALQGALFVPFDVVWTPYVHWLIFYCFFGFDTPLPGVAFSAREQRFMLGLQEEHPRLFYQLADWARSSGRIAEYDAHVLSMFNTTKYVSDPAVYWPNASRLTAGFLSDTALDFLVEHIKNALGSLPPDSSARVAYLPNVSADVWLRASALDSDDPIIPDLERSLIMSRFTIVNQCPSFTTSNDDDVRLIMKMYQLDAANDATIIACENISSLLCYANADVGKAIIAQFQRQGDEALSQVAETYAQRVREQLEKSVLRHMVFSITAEQRTPSLLVHMDHLLDALLTTTHAVVAALRAAYRLWPDSRTWALLSKAKALLAAKPPWIQAVEREHAEARRRSEKKQPDSLFDRFFRNFPSLTNGADGYSLSATELDIARRNSQTKENTALEQHRASREGRLRAVLQLRMDTFRKALAASKYNAGVPLSNAVVDLKEMYEGDGDGDDAREDGHAIMKADDLRRNVAYRLGRFKSEYTDFAARFAAEENEMARRAADRQKRAEADAAALAAQVPWRERMRERMRERINRQ